MSKQSYRKNPVRVENVDSLNEVLVPAVVTWGLHNTICWQDRVGAGFRFNTYSMVGSWHDVDPLIKHKPCFRRICEALPAKKVDIYNRRQGIKIERIYETTEW